MDGSQHHLMSGERGITSYT